MAKMQVAGCDDDERVLAWLREDEAGLQRAMECLYLRKDLQKAAHRTYQRYRRQLDLFTWQDIFCESLLRFCFGVVFRNYQTKSSLAGYFSGICNNYCQELLRKGEKRADVAEEWWIYPERVLFDGEMENLLREVLKQQTDQCQHMFRILFFQPESVPMEAVAKEMGLGNARSAITTFYRCKQKLLAFIRDQGSLLELLKSYL